jgi:hypothetical protein
MGNHPPYSIYYLRIELSPLSGKRHLRQRSVPPGPPPPRRVPPAGRAGLHPRHPDLHLQLGPGEATVPGGKPPAGRGHPGLQRPQPVPLAVQLERVLHSHQRFPPVALHSDHGHAAHEGVHGAVAEGPQEQGRRRRRGVVEQRALGHHRTADSGQFAAPVEVSSTRDLCRFKSVFVGAGQAA